MSLQREEKKRKPQKKKKKLKKKKKKTAHHMNFYYSVTFLARCISSLAMMTCMVTVYGETLPSRNRFCVATKIPIELFGFEASLAQW